MEISSQLSLQGDEQHDHHDSITSTSHNLNSQKRKRDILQENSNENVVKKPSSVISLFTAQDGTRTGPPVELPISSTSKQLDILINTLLENTDPV